jgi:hypothetical protein
MANHEVTPRYHSLTPATGGTDRARADSNTGATARSRRPQTLPLAHPTTSVRAGSIVIGTSLITYILTCIMYTSLSTTLLSSNFLLSIISKNT